MLTIVFDADGLIKLARAGILERVASLIHCITSQQVYNETMRGKEKMYEDAFIIDALVEKGSIEVKRIKPTEGLLGLGLGERSALALFNKIQGDAIISDDRKFLAVLETVDIPFIIPTDLIAILAVHKKLQKTEAIKALEVLRPFVREENYTAASELIGGD